MAVTKQSYYEGESPKIPAPPGYSAPDPHAAAVSQRPFHAPSTPSDGGTGEGVGSVTSQDVFFGDVASAASYTPTVGSASDIAQPSAQAQAQAAFDQMGTHGEFGININTELPRGMEPDGLAK